MAFVMNEHRGSRGSVLSDLCHVDMSNVFCWVTERGDVGYLDR